MLSLQKGEGAKAHSGIPFLLLPGKRFRVGGANLRSVTSAPDSVPARGPSGPVGRLWRMAKRGGTIRDNTYQATTRTEYRYQWLIIVAAWTGLHPKRRYLT